MVGIEGMRFGVEVEVRKGREGRRMIWLYGITWMNGTEAGKEGREREGGRRVRRII